MLGGDASMQTLEEAFDFVQSQTDAVIGIYVRTSLDRRNPTACTPAAPHHFDANFHLKARGRNLRRDHACLGAAHWPPKLAALKASRRIPATPLIGSLAPIHVT